MKKKNLLTYIVTVKDGQDNAEYSGEFKATDAIQAMNDAIDFYTEQLDALPGTVKVSDMRIINANTNDGTKWIAVSRKNENKLDHYQKGNDRIIIAYDMQGLTVETNEIKFYKRDGVVYFYLENAMNDKFHASNTEMIVR